MPSTDFERITLINNGQTAEIREAGISLDGDAAKVYVHDDRSPKWAAEGMDVVVGDHGDVLFAGTVLSIDTARSLGDRYTRVYRCLSD